jgi:hypothetical protein
MIVVTHCDDRVSLLYNAYNCKNRQVYSERPCIIYKTVIYKFQDIFVITSLPVPGVGLEPSISG